MGFVNLIITHYKQRACVFHFSFSKPQPSQQERNQTSFAGTATECLSHYSEAKLVLFFNYNFSKAEKCSQISNGKRQIVQRSTFLCAMLFTEIAERYLQSIFVILSFQLKVIIYLSCGSWQVKCHFCLKDITWPLSFGISLALCLPRGGNIFFT